MMAQLGGAIEYTDCISAEWYDPFWWVSWYDTKQSDGETVVMVVLWGIEKYPFIAITPKSTLTRSGSTW